MKTYNENEKEFMLPNWFKGLFKLKWDKEPDFMVYNNDKPYLSRWWVIPRNRFFNIWIHEAYQSDAPVLHDHPWHNITFVLKNGYKEVVLKYRKNLLRVYNDYTSFEGKDEEIVERKQFGIVFRKAREPHRLVIDKPARTLFITGPVLREWGFHTKEGWIHYVEYKEKDNIKESTTTVPNTVNKDKLDFEF